jgi:hypothetical protein
MERSWGTFCSSFVTALHKKPAKRPFFGTFLPFCLCYYVHFHGAHVLKHNGGFSLMTVGAEKTNKRRFIAPTNLNPTQPVNGYIIRVTMIITNEFNCVVLVL